MFKSFPVLVISALLLIGLPVIVLSQENTEESPDGIAMLPQVSIRNLHVAGSESDKAIQGVFEMKSDEDKILGDLNYQIMLIDPAPELPTNTIQAESFNVYDHIVIPENVTLEPNGSKTVLFNYTPPKVPKGSYRLRLRVINSNDQELGWADTNVTIGEENIGFFELVPLEIKPSTAREIEESDPLAGINVSPNESIELIYGLENVGNSSISGTPTMTIKEWGMHGDTIQTITGTQESLPSGEEKEATFTFAAPDKPTAYRIELSMNDENENRVSTIGEYRLVVSGPSGKITMAQFSELTATNATVDLDVVGPADRTSSVTANVKVAILDGGESVDEQTSDSIELTSEGVMSATFGFELDRVLQEPGLRVTLTRDDGTVLDVYEYNVDTNIEGTASSNSPTKSNNPLYLLGLLIVALVIIVITVLVIVLRKKSNKVTIPSILLMIAVLGGVALTVNASISGNSQGKYYRFTPNGADRLYVYINKPFHQNDPTNEQIDPNSIPIQFDLRWTHCLNRVSFGGFSLDYLKENGHVVPGINDWLPFHDVISQYGIEEDVYNGRISDANRWTVLANNEYSHEDVEELSRNDKFAYLQMTYAGTVSVDPELEDVTMRLAGYTRQERRGSAPVTGWFGTYLWLNFDKEETPIEPLPQSYCTPDTQTVKVNDAAQFTSVMGDSTVWSAPGGSTSFSSGSTFMTSYSTPGEKSVKVMNVVPPYIDVNGDGSITEADAESVINYLNRGTQEAAPGNGSAWQNQANIYDVNNDGNVNPSDALSTVNHIGRHGTGTLPSFTCTVTVVSDTPPSGGGDISGPTAKMNIPDWVYLDDYITATSISKPSLDCDTSFPPPYMDVNGDNKVNNADVEAVVNYLNRGGSHNTTGNGSIWQNQVNVFDVNNDGNAGPSDALTVVNYVHNNGEITVEETQACNDLTNTWKVTRESDGENVTPSNNSANEITVRADRLTNYVFELTVTDGQGRTGQASKKVAVRERDNSLTPQMTQCIVTDSTVAISEVATIKSRFGSNTNWLTTGGTPDAGNGEIFSTAYSNAGTKTVTARFSTPYYIDVNGDKILSMADAAAVISSIERGAGSSVPKTGSPWQNQTNPLDVNNDGNVNPTDAMPIITQVNANDGIGASYLEETCTISVTSDKSPDDPADTPRDPFRPGPIQETN